MMDEEVRNMDEFLEEIDKKVTIPLYEYTYLQSISKEYSKLKIDFLEYMGYDDAFLKTEKGLNKLKKKELVSTILQQRLVIRKLIQELEPSKREEYLSFLDSLYMCKKENT
jgi:hypothetical protein